MNGRDHVLAGSLQNKLQSVVTQVMPEPAKVAAHAKLGGVELGSALPPLVSRGPVP